MEEHPREDFAYEESHILYSIPAFPNEEGITFIRDGEFIDVHDHTETVWCILSLSTGGLSIQEIIEQSQERTGETSELLKAIVTDLKGLGVLQSGTKQYQRFHLQTNNPQTYYQNLGYEQLANYAESDSFVEMEGEKHILPVATTSIASLAEQRKSIRGFENEPVTLQQLGEILNGAYSREISPVPSAGGLYPLRINMVLPVSNGEYRPGYYQYNHNDETMILYNDMVDSKTLEFALNEEGNVFNAPALFVISADLDRQPGKYSNRGYRFTLLEAGHVAQNMHLVAQELGLSTLEYGGFKDEHLKNELQLDEQSEQPIIVMAAGYKSFEYSHNESSEQLLHRLEQSLVGKDRPIKWCEIQPQPPNYKFVELIRATAEYTMLDHSNEDEDTTKYSGGTDRIEEKAKIKAVSEGFERQMSGNIRVDKITPAMHLDVDWLDPREIMPLSDEQLIHHPELQPFSENQPWEWVQGYNLKHNENVLAPIDIIYYPIDKNLVGRELCAHANSSGVAAHIYETKAIESALLELVERDAIMREWYSKQPSPQIQRESLDHHWQRKIDFWNNEGYETNVLDLSHDGIAITNIVIRNKHEVFPYFTNGSAASLDGYNTSIEKAFMEAENGLLAALENQPSKPETIKNISSPHDHGAFYLYPEHKKHIEWLWKGPSTNQQEFQMASMEQLIDMYNPIIFHLSNGNHPLAAVRAISPRVIPINFGYKADHHTHREAQRILSSNHDPNIPHYFA